MGPRVTRVSVPSHMETLGQEDKIISIYGSGKEITVAESQEILRQNGLFVETTEVLEENKTAKI